MRAIGLGVAALLSVSAMAEAQVPAATENRSLQESRPVAAEIVKGLSLRASAAPLPARSSPVPTTRSAATAFSLRDREQAKPAAQPPLPWNQRFTFGSQFYDVEDRWALSAQVVGGQTDPNSRFGFSLIQRNQVTPTPAPKDWVAAGAFYNLTPRVRFGGEVSVSSRPGGGDLKLTAPGSADRGVKLEGALRF